MMVYHVDELVSLQYMDLAFILIGSLTRPPLGLYSLYVVRLLVGRV